MKKIYLLFADLKALLKREKTSIIFMLVSLSISIGVAFPMIAYSSSTLDDLDEIKYLKSVYEISISKPGDAQYTDNESVERPIDIFEDIFFSGKYPKVIGLHYRSLGFYLYPEEPDSEGVIRHIGYYPYFEEESVFFYRDDTDEIIDGRWFSDEDNNNVMVASQKAYPGIKVGDYVDILGRQVKVIGILKNNTYLPYSFIKEVSEIEKGFYTNIFEVQFERPLTAKEKTSLLSYSNIYLRCQYDIAGSTNALFTLMAFAVVTGICFFIVLNMLNVFKHLINKSKYRFMVMKMCGAKKSFVFWEIYFLPLLVTIVSFIIGALINAFVINPYLVEYLEYENLGFTDYLMMFAIIIAAVFAVLLPTVKKITKAEPANTKLWR